MHFSSGASFRLAVGNRGYNPAKPRPSGTFGLRRLVRAGHDTRSEAEWCGLCIGCSDFESPETCPQSEMHPGIAEWMW